MLIFRNLVLLRTTYCCMRMCSESDAQQIGLAQERLFFPGCFFWARNPLYFIPRSFHPWEAKAAAGIVLRQEARVRWSGGADRTKLPTTDTDRAV